MVLRTARTKLKPNQLATAIVRQPDSQLLKGEGEIGEITEGGKYKINGS
jgi:hypothetical protein